MENNINTCARCGYKTQVELFADAHKMVHEARIVRFEPLTTHIALSLSESRSQEDSNNWNKALDMVKELINQCPDCGQLPCQNGDLHRFESHLETQLLQEGPS